MGCNRMLYKYISEHQIEPFTGRVLRVNGRIYANPSESTLKKNGYKELVMGEPLEEKEGYYITTSYSDGEVIKGVYEYAEILDEEASVENDIRDKSEVIE